MSDQGSTGGDIYVDPRHRRRARQTSPPTSTAPPPASTGSATDIHRLRRRPRGHTHLVASNVDTGKDLPSTTRHRPRRGLRLRRPDQGRRHLSSNARHLAFVALQLRRAARDLRRRPAAHLSQITHLNDGLKPALGQDRIHRVDQRRLPRPGLAHLPRQLRPRQRNTRSSSTSTAAPPPSIALPAGGHGGALFSALGYFDLLAQPARQLRPGRKVHPGQPQGLRLRRPPRHPRRHRHPRKGLPIDNNREGITGWSYGGFMTMFAVTQTTPLPRRRRRRRHLRLAELLRRKLHRPVDDPVLRRHRLRRPRRLRQKLRHHYIKNVKTPTLVIVGDRDGECPAPQSFEFWHALRAQGVKTQLVVYPNEGHGFRDPAHIRDRTERTLKWFEQTDARSTSRITPTYASARIRAPQASGNRTASDCPAAQSSNPCRCRAFSPTVLICLPVRRSF